MANLDLLVIQSQKKKRLQSQDQDVSFNTISVGGAAGISIAKNLAGDFSFAGKKLSSVDTPSAATDVATKGYVDALLEGLDPKGSVRTASATNVALSGSTPLIVGGVTLANNERVLLKAQTAGSENGLYSVSITGLTYTLTRTFDADVNADVTSGLYTFVEEGTFGGSGWVLITANPIVLGTTSLSFTQFTGAGSIVPGDGIDISGNTVSVKSSDIVGIGLQEVSNNLEVKPADGIQVSVAGVAVKSSDLVGNGLQEVSNNLEVKSADSSISVTGSGVAVDYTEDFTNVEGSTILAGQIVYESSFGNVELARATDPLEPGTTIGIVYDASILNTATGKITIKPGAVVGGFTGLVVGSAIFLSRDTSGSTTQTLAGFLVGEHIVQIGTAISSSQIVFNPEYHVEY